MPASFPEDPLDGSIRRIAGADGSERNRDAGASPDHEGCGDGVVADAGFIDGLLKRLGMGVGRVHGEWWVGVE
jgi:hypothetical protein